MTDAIIHKQRKKKHLSTFYGEGKEEKLKMTVNKILFVLFSLNFSLICSNTIFDIEILDELNYNEFQPSEELSISESFQNDFKKWKSEEPRAEDSLPTPDMIESYGYVAEVHTVQTEDGYINTLHRIPPKGN